MTTLLLLAAVLCPGEVDVVTAPDACSVVRFDRINGGAAPDYIVIVLGGNGVFAQRPDVNPDVVGKELVHARRLVAELRAAVPEAVIAIGSSMSGSLDQDGWGRNYGARQSCYLANRAWLANDLDTRAAR